MEQQDSAAGVATVAKDQAGQVGQTAADAGGQVAQTTKEQAQNVVGEAKQQARDLVGEARTQVSGQVGSQKSRAVEGLLTLGDELQQMAQQGGQSGIATEVARQASDRAMSLAQYLDRHEPADLLEQFRSYARRRPAMFLAGAAVAGVLAGRLTRNLASSDDDRRALPSGQYDAGRTDFYDAGYQAPVESAYPVTPAPTYPDTGYDQGAYQGTPTGQPGYSAGGGYEPGSPGSGYETGAPGTGYDPAGTPGTGYDQPSGYEQPPARGRTP